MLVTTQWTTSFGFIVLGQSRYHPTSGALLCQEEKKCNNIRSISKRKIGSRLRQVGASKRSAENMVSADAAYKAGADFDQMQFVRCVNSSEYPEADSFTQTNQTANGPRKSLRRSCPEYDLRAAVLCFWAIFAIMKKIKICENKL